MQLKTTTHRKQNALLDPTPIDKKRGEYMRNGRIPLGALLLMALFAGLQGSKHVVSDPRGGGVADSRAALIRPAAFAQTAPIITDARLKGKKLVVSGTNFAAGAVILVDGVAQKTKNDESNVTAELIAKKAGTMMGPDRIARLTVQNPDGVMSEELAFYTGCGSQG